MNISYKWLREYVDTTLTPQQVADALTSIGLEVGSVEEVQTIRGGLAGLVVGQVLTCEPHPNSDHMHVCTVDLGQEQPEQIVCGAPNVAAGQKVIVATLGTKLYDGDNEFVIKRSKLRGIESNGMICAEDEIGVGESHDGIIVLPADTPVGKPAAEVYGLESDYVIEVDITANRADACSHYGVARDLYAWLVQNGHKTALHRPSVDAFHVDNHDLQIPVRVVDAAACPRYAAVTITDCHVGESPKWLKEHLATIGLRSINNIVDITNYVMMAFGQPLHCFDADMIEGQEIVVQTLPEGTPFQTLDGVDRKLSAQDLMICNAKEPMCIAGVYGGRGSGTYESTRNVLLESAYFNPTSIRRSARRHGLQTDASFRFERGIDPAGQIYALKLAAMLCQQLAGGKVSMEITDIYPQPIKDFSVSLAYDYVDKLVGQHIEPATIKSIVTSLEMHIEAETHDGIELTVPAYRVDVQRPCDVVEDILRIYGYNNIEIPSSLNSTLTVKGAVDRSFRLQDIVSEQLVGAGFNEILNNSLQRGAYYEQLQAYPAEQSVRLLNPLSQDLNVLRQTLLFGGLETISRNVNHRRPNLQLFEFGNCYHYHAERKSPDIIPGVSSSRDPEVIKHILDAYSEEMHLALWATGKRVADTWADADADQSFYVLKGHVVNILARLGIPFGALVFKDGDSDVFAKSIHVETRAGKTLAELGTVAHHIQMQFDIPAQVFYADICWNVAMKLVAKQDVKFHELPKFPAVSRDLALLVDKTVEFAQIEAIAYQTERKLLQSVSLFDVYEGKNLPAGKKSYAVNFRLQDPTRTMSDKTIDAIMQKLIQNLTKQLGAELR